VVWRAWRWTSASSLASAITRFEHHWTTVDVVYVFSASVLPCASRGLAVREESYQMPTRIHIFRS
jgi:hypothetical protein